MRGRVYYLRLTLLMPLLVPLLVPLVVAGATVLALPASRYLADFRHDLGGDDLIWVVVPAGSITFAISAALDGRRFMGLTRWRHG